MPPQLLQLPSSTPPPARRRPRSLHAAHRLDRLGHRLRGVAGARRIRWNQDPAPSASRWRVGSPAGAATPTARRRRSAVTLNTRAASHVDSARLTLAPRPAARSANWSRTVQDPAGAGELALQPPLGRPAASALAPRRGQGASSNPFTSAARAGERPRALRVSVPRGLVAAADLSPGDPPRPTAATLTAPRVPASEPSRLSSALTALAGASVWRRIALTPPAPSALSRPVGQARFMSGQSSRRTVRAAATPALATPVRRVLESGELASRLAASGRRSAVLDRSASTMRSAAELPGRRLDRWSPARLTAPGSGLAAGEPLVGRSRLAGSPSRLPRPAGGPGRADESVELVATRLGQAISGAVLETLERVLPEVVRATLRAADRRLADAL